jgi:hypothetical protein
VTRLRPGSGAEPVTESVCVVLPGQSASRPCDGTVAESVARSGLSHVSDGFSLLNQDPVVADAEQAAAMAPFGAGGEIRGARVDRHGHLDVVAEAEARAPRLGAVPLRGRHAQREIQILLHLIADAEVGDVATHPHVEALRQRHERVGHRARARLYTLLYAVGDPQHTVTLDGERRSGGGAVEIGDLVPFEPRLDAPELLEAGAEALVAIADVVGLRVKETRVRVARVACRLEDRSVAQIAIAYETRLVTVDAANAHAEQRRAELGIERLLLGRLRLRERREAKDSGEDERRCGAHVRLRVRYRRNVAPDGWFEPWMFEWQLTQPRPIRRLLFAASEAPS